MVQIVSDTLEHKSFIQELTHAGVSVLRFDDQGQVVEHRDYAHHIE